MSATPGGFAEWRGLYRLNASIVDGATDPYRIALAVEEYLRTRYKYSLKPPKTDYLSPYAAFLFDTKTGYCQHFAGAMAVLLRFNGIPARVAVGFTTGEKVGDGTYVVTRNDAHAWVEAYFPGVGWVPFDPTRAGCCPSSETRRPAGPDAAIAGLNVPGVTGAATPAAAGPRGHDRNPRERRRRRRAPPRRRRSSAWIRWTAVPGARPDRLARGPRAATPARPSSRHREARLRASLALLYTRSERPRRRRATLPDARRDRPVPAERFGLDAGDLPAASRRSSSGAARRRTRTSPTSPRSAAACAAGYASARGVREPCSRSTAFGGTWVTRPRSSTAAPATSCPPADG